MKELERLKVDYPQILEIRGLGLMIGVVLDQPAAPIVKQLMHKGIIANATAETVLRLVPPLNIPKADLKTFLTAFAEVLTEIAEHAK